MCRRTPGLEWTHPGPYPRNSMQITLSGSSESEIWTPLDPDPRYIMRIMLSDPQNIMQITLSGSSDRFPVGFRSVSTQQFASILWFTINLASQVLRTRILDASGPRSSKHYANYSLRELRSEIWTPLDPDPRYFMQIMLSGSSELEFWTLRADPSPYPLQAIDQLD